MAGIDPRVVIEEFLDSHDLEYDRKDNNTFLLTLPGEKKLQTHCALVVGDHSLSINAFVIRRPDDNADQVHAWCMSKNASMYGIAFATNEVGDIFLVGRLPLFAVTDRELDRLIGSVLQYSDNSFNPLLELGFANAIRREWAWRVSRGESLANLDAFKHTLLELNKDIYFGDNLVLTITWQQSTKFVIQSASEVNPLYIQAAVPLQGGGVTAAIAATTRTSSVAPIMNNLSLFVACETNADIVAGLIQKVNSEGFTLNVPFTYCPKLITPNSTSTAIQQRINRTYGSHLLRCYTAVYDQLEADITMFNHPDRNIIDYNTFMDGLRLQDYTIKVSDSTHWLTNERNFQGSCIQALAQYKDHCVHIDNWTGDPSCLRDDTVAAGLELGSDRTYSIQYNNAAVAATYRIYLYFITQKQLVISKGILNVV